MSRWLDEGPRPLVLGLCGSQGSGKSTLANQLVEHFSRQGLKVATLSLDDLYLPHATRQALARDVHPLLATRGVPLTHDVGEGLCLLVDAKAGKPVRLPRFDKANDDRVPLDQWSQAEGELDLMIFEGWCLGAAPVPEAALAEPINALERNQDADGRWRRAVNTALAGPYQALFGLIDRLILLAAPDFEVVRRWRLDQEDELRAKLAAEGRDPALAMDATAIDRFVQHYERITRAILAELPGRADLTLHLNYDRDPSAET